MTRSRIPTSLGVVLILTTQAAAQQTASPVVPGARIVGPSGPGLQPQINTSPYSQMVPGPASWAVDPFAGPGLFPGFTPPGWRASRPGPFMFAPAPVPAPFGLVNNPAMFNAGLVPPFALPIPPGAGAGLPANGPAFNPVLVGRPGTSSAYYTPPLPARPTGSSAKEDDPTRPGTGPVLYPVTGPGTPSDSRSSLDADAAFNPSAGVVIRPGEFRFLPWMW